MALDALPVSESGVARRLVLEELIVGCELFDECAFQFDQSPKEAC